MTELQNIYYNYLLAKLNFNKDEFFKGYIQELTKSCSRYRSLGAKKARYDPKTKELLLPYDHDFKKYQLEGELLLPTSFSMIDYLHMECEIKRKRKYYTLKTDVKSVTASQISSFTYCPVSFSISRTFKVQKLISATVGESFHQQHRLLNYVQIDVGSGQCSTPAKPKNLISFKREIDSDAAALVEEIHDSVAVHVDNSESGQDAKVYTSKDGKYSGKPDYIFFNNKSKEYFVVEEKFQCIPKMPDASELKRWRYEHKSYAEEILRIRSDVDFFENHLNQLRSYIYGVKEFKLSHGYLVYWRYSIEKATNHENKHTCKVEQVRAKKILRSDNSNRQKLVSVFKHIQSFLTKGEMEFNIETQRNPNKCANCVVGYLCGHKTGRFSQVTAQYQEDFLKLTNVPFPEELKK